MDNKKKKSHVNHSASSPNLKIYLDGAAAEDFHGQHQHYHERNISPGKTIAMDDSNTKYSPVVSKHSHSHSVSHSLSSSPSSPRGFAALNSSSSSIGSGGGTSTPTSATNSPSLGHKHAHHQKKPSKLVSAFKRVKGSKKLKKEIEELSLKSGLNQQYTAGSITPDAKTLKSKKVQRKSRFIEPVSQSTEDYSDIPRILKLSIEYLFEKALNTFGLFRESANALELQRLSQIFEKGEEIDLSDYSDHHCIAGLIKLYFRERKTAIFPYELHKEIYQAMNEDEPDSNLNIKNILETGLCKNVFLILRYLFELLHAIHQNCQENKMNSQNLAICFAPSLIQSFDSSCIHVIEKLIEDYESIFSVEVIVEQSLSNIESVLGSNESDSQQEKQPNESFDDNIGSEQTIPQIKIQHDENDDDIPVSSSPVRERRGSFRYQNKHGYRPNSWSSKRNSNLYKNKKRHSNISNSAVTATTHNPNEIDNIMSDFKELSVKSKLDKNNSNNQVIVDNGNNNNNNNNDNDQDKVEIQQQTSQDVILVKEHKENREEEEQEQEEEEESESSDEFNEDYESESQEEDEEDEEEEEEEIKLRTSSINSNNNNNNNINNNNNNPKKSPRQSPRQSPRHSPRSSPRQPKKPTMNRTISHSAFTSGGGYNFGIYSPKAPEPQAKNFASPNKSNTLSTPIVTSSPPPQQQPPEIVKSSTPTPKPVLIHSASTSSLISKFNTISTTNIQNQNSLNSVHGGTGTWKGGVIAKKQDPVKRTISIWEKK